MSETWRPGFTRLDAEHQALVGDAAPGFGDSSSTSPTRNVAFVSPCTPSTVERDVEVDDVAVGQRAVVGDAVADDLVDRGAQRLAGSRCS